MTVTDTVATNSHGGLLAVYGTSSTFTISGSSFLRSTSGGSGGGFYVDGSALSTFTISSTTFTTFTAAT